MQADDTIDLSPPSSDPLHSWTTIVRSDVFEPHPISSNDDALLEGRQSGMLTSKSHGHSYLPQSDPYSNVSLACSNNNIGTMAAECAAVTSRADDVTSDGHASDYLLDDDSENDENVLFSPVDSSQIAKVILGSTPVWEESPVSNRTPLASVGNVSPTMSSNLLDSWGDDMGIESVGSGKLGRATIGLALGTPGCGDARRSFELMDPRMSTSGIAPDALQLSASGMMVTSVRLLVSDFVFKIKKKKLFLDLLIFKKTCFYITEINNCWGDQTMFRV